MTNKKCYPDEIVFINYKDYGRSEYTKRVLMEFDPSSNQIYYYKSEQVDITIPESYLSQFLEAIEKDELDI